jgi:protoporphyrinogen oxidase
LADVAIIGAGPAGLTAAYLLSKKGYSVTVIEKDRASMSAASAAPSKHDGYRFDIGGHRFFSKRRKWSTCGTRSCPMISSSARG